MITDQNNLESIIQLLHRHLKAPVVNPLGQVGVFQCVRNQLLRRVPIEQPSVILVLRGEKRLVLTNKEYRLTVGEMALLPVGCEVHIENRVSVSHQEYLALSVGFCPEIITGFLSRYGNKTDWQKQQPCVCTVAPASYLLAMQHRVSWCLSGDTDNDVVNELRQQELLSILAHHHVLGQLLGNRQPQWRQKVSAMLLLDLSYPWKLPELCQRLGVSESSLRRHLQAENIRFRELLESTRLSAALALLQETTCSIAEVSDKVGYQSQSRFSERFKKRFDMTPTQLKASRVARVTE